MQRHEPHMAGGERDVVVRANTYSDREDVRMRAGIALVLLAAVILIGCGGAGSDDTTLEPGGRDAGSSELIHVHGLGLNPAAICFTPRRTTASTV